jgi:mono/diheme cytochrome c family protein
MTALVEGAVTVRPDPRRDHTRVADERELPGTGAGLAARIGLGLTALAIACAVAMLAQIESPTTARASSAQDCAAYGVSGCGNQGAAGAVVYGSICVNCHGERLEGADAPAIAGPRADLRQFRTARGLYEYVSVWMPDDAPGSLSEREYLDAVAFLLHANGVHPGGQLGTSDLEAITLP